MAAGQEIADELAGKPVVTHLVGRDGLCLGESVFCRAVVSGVRVASRDIDQKPGIAFGELRRQPYRTGGDIPDGLLRSAELNRNRNVVNDHVSWTEHRAKHHQVLAKLAGVRSGGLQRRVGLIAIAPPGGSRRSAEHGRTAQTQRSTPISVRRRVQVRGSQECDPARLLEVAGPHVDFCHAPRRSR